MVANHRSTPQPAKTKGSKSTRKTSCLCIELFAATTLTAPGHGSELVGQLSRGVVLVGAVHEQRYFPGFLSPHRFDQLPALRGVARLARTQTPGDDAAIIRGNQMKLGAPACTVFADGLGTVFFSAPVPSGCTLMMVESRQTASMRTCIRRRRCSCSKSVLRTPALAQRLMRIYTVWGRTGWVARATCSHWQPRTRWR